MGKPRRSNMCTMGLASGKDIRTDCSINAQFQGKTYCFGSKEAFPCSLGRQHGVETYPLHGHQADRVSVMTLASVADLSCASSSSNTIRSNSASVIPSGRQMPTPLGT